MVEHNEGKQRARDELFAKYDATGLERGERLFGEPFLRMVSLNDALDPDWTNAWLNYVYGYMYGREVLSERTRILVVIGQHIAAGHYDDLRMHMESAIKAGVEPREILEVCLHAPLYVGMPTLRHSLGAFRAVMVDLGIATYDDPPFEYFRTRDEK
jgi:4-carboxymuconolactone decarboxylase